MGFHTPLIEGKKLNVVCLKQNVRIFFLFFFLIDSLFVCGSSYKACVAMGTNP